MAESLYDMYMKDQMSTALPVQSSVTSTVNDPTYGLKAADYVTPSSNTSWLDIMGFSGDNTFGLNKDQWSGLATLGGLASMAVSLPGKLEYYNNRNDLLKQQLASNEEAMANRRAFNENWKNASSNVWGNSSNGLAAKSTLG